MLMFNNYFLGVFCSWKKILLGGIFEWNQMHAISKKLLFNLLAWLAGIGNNEYNSHLLQSYMVSVWLKDYHWDTEIWDGKYSSFLFGPRHVCKSIKEENAVTRQTSLSAFIDRGKLLGQEIALEFLSLKVEQEVID